MKNLNQIFPTTIWVPISRPFHKMRMFKYYRSRPSDKITGNCDVQKATMELTLKNPHWPWVASIGLKLGLFTDYGDVSEWVKNSRVGWRTPNNQTNLEFIQWINVIRFLFPHCELSRVSFPVWKEQTIVAPGAGELKTQLSPLGKMHFHYVTIISR